jgi:sulfide:quinone oxidoreductase
MLLTPEPVPLKLFGREASEVVGALLEKHGVRFIGETIAVCAQSEGALALASSEMIAADRLVAAPEFRARVLNGVPTGRSGFVPVDEAGRVLGLEDVYAAGDMTTSPIKAGSLAAQQADVVAQTIAAGLGIVVKKVRTPHVLHGRLLGGERPVFLRTELDWTGQPTRATLVRADDDGAARTAKVIGRYLVPYLETRKPIADHRAAA